MVARNADGTMRLTIDFRKLNPHVKVDNYSMPNRDAVLEKLWNAEFMSKLGFTKAYFQISLDGNSKKLTSFVTEFGQYEFNCVPFGISFASGLCNRILKEILGDHLSLVTSFVDDLVIFSENFDTHLNHVQTILSHLSETGITLNSRE